MHTQMSEQGLRVLALAAGRNTTDGLTLVGLVGIVDPPRDGIDHAVSMLKKGVCAHVCARGRRPAGILSKTALTPCVFSGVFSAPHLDCTPPGGLKVVMMTGDARETASSIARQLHILDPSVPVDRQVQSGQAFDVMDERDQAELVKDITVFFRATPQHKLAIVRAWQANGAIVAMTGDGVNDAPALKMADIGIAMGLSGTDVSKEAADMILVDDNFQTILAAIEEGKSIYHNIKNFVRFQLSTAIAALSLITLSTVRGTP